ncbi:MAG: hypothetical protein Q7T63_15555 [Burkholderiaceae bacterium]|nr:hypothetical protein [Burkholderiaceae bacterium]MDO9090155.1 hypothetical protein [Burkholderiaceae bacterium]
MEKSAEINPFTCREDVSRHARERGRRNLEAMLDSGLLSERSTQLVEDWLDRDDVRRRALRLVLHRGVVGAGTLLLLGALYLVFLR